MTLIDALLLILGVSFLTILLLFATLYLPHPAFESLVKIIGNIPGVKWSVVFIDPLQKRYSSKLAKDVHIKSEASVSVEHNRRSNPSFVKPISTLQVNLEIENRSPVDVSVGGAEIHIAFASDGVAFKTIQWNSDLAPQPPNGFKIETVSAKKDGYFTFEFLPPIFLYYTSLDRERVGRTLYFSGWIILDTGFGNTLISFTSETSISDQQVRNHFARAKEDFENGFSIFQQ